MIEFDTVALVLSGGNALGSYQAGAYQALEEYALEPGWVAAASAGAVNGAIICGSPVQRRLARLEDFWQPAPAGTGESPWSRSAEDARRTAAASLTMATGRTGAFTPRRLWGPLWDPFVNPEPASLYDTTPLGATLERMVDFDLLNEGSTRLSVTAVDLESGGDVVFDTQSQALTIEHLRASSALLPAFPPVEVEGRMLADGGISANLPLDVVLRDPPPGRTLCIALDLLPQAASRPSGLGEAASRMQDLIFASQSRRAIAAWQAIFDARVATDDGKEAQPAVTVLQIAYADQGREVAGKAFDFSALSARARWDAGHRDLGRALAQLQAGQIDTDRPGLSVYRLDRAAPDDEPVLRLSHESLIKACG